MTPIMMVGLAILALGGIGEVVSFIACPVSMAWLVLGGVQGVRARPGSVEEKKAARHMTIGFAGFLGGMTGMVICGLIAWLGGLMAGAAGIDWAMTNLG
jgi:hypothetical protein